MDVEQVRRWLDLAEQFRTRSLSADELVEFTSTIPKREEFAATLAAPPVTADNAEKCPRCEGTGKYRRFCDDPVGDCALCNGTGLMSEAVKEPVAADIAEGRDQFGGLNPGSKQSWRQGFTGNFQELCEAYGKACAAISQFEDDASVPLDVHIAELVSELARLRAERDKWKAAYEKRGERVEALSKLCEDADNRVYALTQELARLRAATPSAASLTESPATSPPESER